jgi:uncharacterized DUF497 family protein
MEDGFEWDDNKERANRRKHGVSFTEAKTVFDDPFCLIVEDVLHSTGENRFLAIGYSSSQDILVVIYTERGYNIRIISARSATRGERRLYEQG